MLRKKSRIKETVVVGDAGVLKVDLAAAQASTALRSPGRCRPGTEAHSAADTIEVNQGFTPRFTCS